MILALSTHGCVLLSFKEGLLSHLECFYSFLGDLWAFLPIYLPAKAAANSNVPFSFEAKILEHYISSWRVERPVIYWDFKTLNVFLDSVCTYNFKIMRWLSVTLWILLSLYGEGWSKAPLPFWKKDVEVDKKEDSTEWGGHWYRGSGSWICVMFPNFSFKAKWNIRVSSISSRWING